MPYELELEQGLTQQLNQFQIQSLNILSLDNYELEQFLQNEFIENPMMEYQPDRNPAPVMSGNAGGWKEEKEIQIKDDTPKEKKEIFLEQMELSAYSDREQKIMEYMMDCLEESGLLMVPEEEISAELGEALELCRKCREELMKLEPAGVFAGDLAECLIVQLERSGQMDDNLQKIIEEYLDEVAAGHIAAISRGLKISTAQVRKYIHMIQNLNPRPLCGYSFGKAQYIVPDILLFRVDHQWKIQLNDQWMENYAINDYYLRMMEQIEDPELKEYFYKKYQRCRFIIASIEQRRETILKISQAVVERQSDHFRGKGKLRPMTMQQIADDTGMHVSTISRAVKGKYLQYGSGTVSVKSLFTAAFGNQEKTAGDMKEEIKKIIEEENKKKPYSDQKISKILEERGIRISRRTVAKYREEMGIRGTYDRKEVGN